MNKSARRPVPKHIFPLIATVFILLFLWLSTVPLLSWYQFFDLEEELRDASDRWEASEVVSYSYRYEISSYYAPPVAEPVVVDVRDAEVIQIRKAATGERLDPVIFSDAPLTIESLFQELSEVFSSRPYKVAVEYDTQYGFPARISVNFDRETPDNIQYSITMFEALPTR